ncbi:HAD family hydrolase [Candidatus Woesebacteria bacterium]|nr:HAD family hydrolase [Candidatus Woesebacteria bacterium]
MKLFVWDFHGTLEKGNENAVLEMSNFVLEKHGYKQRLLESQCRELYGKKWYEYFEYLLPDESNATHLALQEDCFSFSIAHPEIIVKYISLVDHALEVLEAIKEKHDQILISNTKPASLAVFTQSVGVSHIFPNGKSFATDSHAKNKTKKDVLRKYLSRNIFEEVITIGDSPGDVELGAVFGAKTFLYTHPGQAFKDCEPYFKINDLREVLKVMQ